MSSPTPDWTAVVERLEKLERQNRRMKQAAGAFLVLVSLGLIASCQRPLPRTIEANELVLRDEEGTMRAWLGTEGDGTTMALYGRNGLRRIGLEVGTEAESLRFFDPAGNHMVSLQVDSDFSGLDMISALPGARVSIEAGADSASFVLRDKNGKELAWKVP